MILFIFNQFLLFFTALLHLKLVKLVQVRIYLRLEFKHSVVIMYHYRYITICIEHNRRRYRKQKRQYYIIL